MLHVLSNEDRHSHQDLFIKMFRARAIVFSERLGWDVDVHEGLEYDHHDDESDPLYLILTDASAEVTASLRLLPTTGETMLTQEFAHMFDGPVDVRGPAIWECTRFCVPHGGDPTQHLAASQASSDLLMALCQHCLDHGIDHILGVFERPMTRIYRRIGWSPEILARSKPEVGSLFVGIWTATEAALENMRLLAAPRVALA